MRFLLLTVITISLLASCGTSQNKQDPNALTPTAKGDTYYGGVFKFNETEYFRSLYPLNITEVVGHRISNQIFEGLVTFDQKTLDIKPALATDWTVNENATSFTFNIRQDAYFHDNACFPNGKGRQVNAYDFEYCLSKACFASADNQAFPTVTYLIKGAKDYYEASQTDQPLNKVEGINVIDSFTIQIELKEPFAGFLNRLALPFCEVFPKEAVQHYGKDIRVNPVGTGPFQLKKIIPDVSVILIKNDNYWGKDEFGNQLPYLNGVKVSFIKEEKIELLEFTKGNLHMKYRLPLEMVHDIRKPDGTLTTEYAQFQLQETVEMTVQYYGYLHLHEIFKDKRIRQAFNYAIDRQKIVDYTVKGQGIPATHGIVPTSFHRYNHQNVTGQNFNPEKARQLLSMAGYPGGEGFPTITLTLNSGGGRNTQIAEAIQKMLKENLNVNIELQQSVFAQHIENLETGKSAFWRLGWIADYPDPETFLNLFYGIHYNPNVNEKAYINSFRYLNPEFDEYLAEALQTVDKDKRYRLYEKADQVAADDAVVMNIYYPINNRLLQPYVRNYPQNPMEFRKLRDVYFVPQ